MKLYVRYKNLRVHFAHCHAQETIMIPEGGNQPYPRCPKCDMFVWYKALNSRRLTAAFCRWGEERNRRHLWDEETRVGEETVITAYGILLALFTSLKYPGRFILSGGRWMGISGQKPLEITSEVCADNKGVDQGGCGWTDLRTDLLGGGPAGHTVWVRDVGHDPPHWEGFGRIPSQGCPQGYG